MRPLILILIVLFNAPVLAQQWSISDSIYNESPYNPSRFGFQFEFNDPWLITSDPTQGVVYCYRKINETWELTQVIQHFDNLGNPINDFGFQLKHENKTLLINSPNEQRIYSYRLHANGTWEFIENIDVRQISGKRIENFGKYLSLHKDRLVTTQEIYDRDLKLYISHLVVYRKNSKGQWLFEQLFPSGFAMEGDDRGTALAQNDTQIIVGIPNTDPWGSSLPGKGKVYVYNKDGANKWALQQELRNPIDSIDFTDYGMSLALHGNMLVVGAPSNEVFPGDTLRVRGGGSLFLYESDHTGKYDFSYQLYANDYGNWEHLGWTVDMDDKAIIVGVSGENHDEHGENDLNSAGAVYVFEQDSAGKYTQAQKIVKSNRTANHGFGLHVQLSDKQILASNSPWPIENADGIKIWPLAINIIKREEVKTDSIIVARESRLPVQTGDTVQFKAHIFPFDPYKADVVWSVNGIESSPGFAEILPDGRLVALGAGLIEVIATNEDTSGSKEERIIPFKGASHVYPNPVADKVSFRSNSDEVKVEIYNQQGRLEAGFVITVENGLATFPVNLEKGMYFLIVRGNNELTRLPFIKL